MQIVMSSRAEEASRREADWLEGGVPSRNKFAAIQFSQITNYSAGNETQFWIEYYVEDMVL